MNQEESIKEVLAQYVQAVHVQDEEAFRSLWTGKDTDTMISIKTIFRGIDHICADFLIGGIRKTFTKIDLIADSEPEIHFLNEDTAVMIFCYHTECIRRDDGSDFGISGVETQVLVRTPEGWKLNHIHYSM